MHRVHHPLQHRVEDRPGLFRVALGQELHRALEISEEHGDLLGSPSMALREVRIFSARWLGDSCVGLGVEGPWAIRLAGWHPARRISSLVDCQTHNAGSASASSPAVRVGRIG